MLLALDLGTTTGYAFGRQGVLVSGAVSFKPDKFAGGGMRFVLFRRWLHELPEIPTRVAYEAVRMHAAVDAAHIYGGLMATLTAWCEERKVPYEGVPVATIKKYWTGKGNAKKEHMIEAAQLLGFNPKDDNEADALAIYHYIKAHEVRA